MIKAVIFDLDGTLLDTLDDLTDSLNFTIRNYQSVLYTKDDVRRFIGNGIPKLIELALIDGLNNPKYEEVLANFKAYYKCHANVKTVPYEGIMELLNTLKHQGYRLAIVSNKADIVVKDISKYYFNDLFEISLGESSLIKRKPAPDMLLKVTSDMGLSIDEVLYVGDSEVDVKTALNASCKVASVLWGFRDKSTLIDAGGNIFVSSPHELLDVLK